MFDMLNEKNKTSWYIQGEYFSKICKCVTKENKNTKDDVMNLWVNIL